MTRQLCNVWKADRAVAATTLSERNAAFAAQPRRTSTESASSRTTPSGSPRAASRSWSTRTAAYLDYPRPAEHGHLLDGARRHRPRRPGRSTTCVDRTGGRTRRPAAASTPRTDWLSWLEEMRPAGVEVELVPVEVPRGGAAFHDTWVFHGSPANTRPDAERRSIISHFMDAEHPVGTRQASAPDLFALPPTGRGRDGRGVLPGAVARGRLPHPLACRVPRS